MALLHFSVYFALYVTSAVALPLSLSLFSFFIFFPFFFHFFFIFLFLRGDCNVTPLRLSNATRGILFLFLFFFHEKEAPKIGIST